MRQEHALKKNQIENGSIELKKLRYKLPDAPVTNEENFRARNTHGNRLSAEERIIRDGKYRLISLNLASTGLAFVELGKGNVLQIQRSITGPVLAGRKVKTKEKHLKSGIR